MHGRGRRMADGARLAAMAVLFLAAGCQTQPTNFGKSEDIVDPAAGSAGQYRLAHHGHRAEPERRQRLQCARHRLWPRRQAPRGDRRFRRRDQDQSRASTRPMPTARWSQRRSAATSSPSPTTTWRSQINPRYAVAYVGRGNIYRQNKQHGPGARRFQPGDRARRQRSARLPQSRTDLPGEGPAPAGDRRFHQGDLARARQSPSPSRAAASPISRPATTRRRSKTSTKW